MWRNENRFNQSDLSVISEIESLLVDAANGQDISAIPDVLTKYNIDLGRLKTQLLLLPDTISSAFAGSVSVKRTTNVRTIAEALNQSNIVKGMLSEVDKLVQAYLIFPVTSATAERSFSALRRIKTYLRSSMTAQRLNNLFVLYVHKTLTDSLNLESIAREFISVNSRRMNYFGHF